MSDKIVYKCVLNAEPTPAKCVEQKTNEIVDFALCGNALPPCIHREKHEIGVYRKWDDVTNIKTESSSEGVV
jgi:hypothetical protein